MRKLRAFAETLARPWLLFYALPWLMLLLVAGTVAQRYLGLYAAQGLFFGSFILWIGPLPVPGAYSVLTLIALSLIAKLALKSPFRRHNAGTLIAHASILVLLLGGLVTALQREEGYMVLAEGETSRAVSDYRLRELVVLKNDAPVAALPLADLNAGRRVAAAALPFTLTVIHACYPCVAFARSAFDSTLKGPAAALEIAQGPEAADEAQNRAGAILRVEGAGAGQDGLYLTLEQLAAQPEIHHGPDRYAIIMRPAQRALAFEVTLERFAKDDYPGTDMASAYRSDVTVKDGALHWSDRIEMNHPLRLRGYTLYQSSFVEAGGKRLSVLAVVKNAGQWFPYIALTALCIGLLLHLLRVFRRAQP